MIIHVTILCLIVQAYKLGTTLNENVVKPTADKVQLALTNALLISVRVESLFLSHISFWNIFIFFVACSIHFSQYICAHFVSHLFVFLLLTLTCHMHLVTVLFLSKFNYFLSLSCCLKYFIAIFIFSILYPHLCFYFLFLIPFFYTHFTF